MTEDKRIESGSVYGNIYISSYDLKKKKWKRQIRKKEAHNKVVLSLCSWNGNRLLSSSYEYGLCLS